MAVTFSPIVLSSKPVEEAMIPLPMPLMLPPETSTYFIAISLCPPMEGGREEVEGSGQPRKVYPRR